MKPGSCQCPNQPERPCGNLATAEDLLCDACRDVKNGTGNCAAMSMPCCGTFHFTLILRPPLASYVHAPPEGA
jgi:hypothetical protein